MRSRREFLQLAAITTALIGSKSLSSVAANQSLTSDHLLDFDSKGQISILHITDLHGQLKPVYFRPPSENYGVGSYEESPLTSLAKIF